jgi:voltage-gated potassium channel
VSGPGPATRSAIGTVLIVAAATAVYYVIPVPGRMSQDSWAIMFFAGTAALGVLILVAGERLLRGAETETARVRSLVVLLSVTLLFFSWADRSVAALPGQFADLHSRTDALYFNVSTLATVGYGDVHPAGQLARAAVTLQIVFNLIFLGAAITLITGVFRTRARGRMHPSHRPDGGEEGSGTGTRES